MVARPFLSPATAARINAAATRGFATALAIGPVIPLTLHYDDAESGVETQIGPKDVLVEYANREAQVSGSPAGGYTESDGTFSAWAPWGARQGARFVLPSGARGRITLVEEARNGVVRARFSLRSGG